MKNNWITMVVVAVMVGALAFAGGMQYQKSKKSNFNGSFNSRQLQEGGDNDSNGTQRRQGNSQGMQPVSGEIISQDENGITIKTQDGSSKIIILSDKTVINKTSEGSESDLETGKKVTVFGTTNSDQSVTAQTISIGNNLSGMPVGRSQSGQNPSESTN